MNPFQNDWQELLKEECKQPYYLKLMEYVEAEYEAGIVYPAKRDIFNAFHYTAYEDTKVVILGQDPYHGPHQAHGLSFSVQRGVKAPPSLKNIFKELQQDLGCSPPDHGYLLPWAEQGVLLLNTVLTVRQSEPNSHKGKGWERLTNRVIELLNDRSQPIVFILWGRQAQEKKALISSPQHCVLEAAHPSPFSANRGFFGSQPFSKANRFLLQTGQEPIDWNLN